MSLDYRNSCDTSARQRLAHMPAYRDVCRGQVAGRFGLSVWQANLNLPSEGKKKFAITLAGIVHVNTHVLPRRHVLL